jgi:hypothetical protein
MTRPHVSLDAETGHAYISLAEPSPDGVATSVSLWPVDDQPQALASLVLDFDSDGRLVGITVLDPADRVLRRELLRGSDHRSIPSQRATRRLALEHPPPDHPHRDLQ